MKLLLVFPVSKLANLLVTVLSTYYTKLQSLDLSTAYGSPHLQSGNLFYIRVAVDQTYEQAALSCNKLYAELFTVREGTNVKMIFNSLGVQRSQVYTGIYRSKALPAFLDTNRFPPLNATQYDTIDVTALDLDSVTATQNVAIQMIDQQLRYVIREKSETANSLTICCKEIPYPMRIANIQNLMNIREAFQSEVARTLKDFEELAKYVGNELDLLPSQGETPDPDPDPDQTENLSLPALSNMESEIVSWQQVLDERAQSMVKVNNDLEVADLIVQHGYFMNDLKHMAWIIQRFVVSPTQMVASLSTKLATGVVYTVYKTLEQDKFLITEKTAAVATAVATVAASPVSPATATTTDAAVGGKTATPATQSPSPSTLAPLTTAAFTPRGRSTVTPRIVTFLPITTTPTSITTPQNVTNHWFLDFVSDKWTWGLYLSWFVHSFLRPTFWELFNMLLTFAVILVLSFTTCKKLVTRRRRNVTLPRVRSVRSVQFTDSFTPTPTPTTTFTRSHSAPTTPLRFFSINERTTYKPTSLSLRSKKKPAPPPPYVAEFSLERYYPIMDQPLLLPDAEFNRHFELE